MKDYTGKKLFLGIDVHKNSYSVTAIFDGQIVKKDRLPADVNQLVSYCKRHFPGAPLSAAYEAGFCGYSLHRKLTRMGIENRIVHPAGIEMEARARVKNDKRDSRKIAEHLSQGRLRGIHVPTEQREAYREVSRLRETLSRSKRRVAAQIKSFLHRQGLFQEHHDRGITEKLIKELLSMDLSRDLHFTIGELCDEWQRLNSKMKDVEKKLQEQADEDPFEETYRSLPGIGPTIARILATELGDCSQFSNQEKLFSFVGLTPREHSSGEHRWMGHITKQGNPNVRKALVQAAWKAIAVDEELKERYEKLSSRRGARRAIVAIARVLIGYAKTCFKENRLYEVRKPASIAQKSTR